MHDRLPADRPDWFDDARCLGAGELWFAADRDDQTEAIAICAECPVQVDCLAHALIHREQYGIWGGKTPDERRSLVDLGRQLRRRRG